jgi:hypothetical protein
MARLKRDWWDSMVHLTPAWRRELNVMPAVGISSADYERFLMLRKAAWEGDAVARPVLWDLLEDAGSYDVWFFGRKMPLADARALAGV